MLGICQMTLITFLRAHIGKKIHGELTLLMFSPQRQKDVGVQIQDMYSMIKVMFVRAYIGSKDSIIHLMKI